MESAMLASIMATFSVFFGGGGFEADEVTWG
jgi:hypothetical protein